MEAHGLNILRTISNAKTIKELHDGAFNECKENPITFAGLCKFIYQDMSENYLNHNIMTMIVLLDSYQFIISGRITFKSFALKFKCLHILLFEDNKTIALNTDKHETIKQYLYFMNNNIILPHWMKDYIDYELKLIDGEIINTVNNTKLVKYTDDLENFDYYFEDECYDSSNICIADIIDKLHRDNIKVLYNQVNPEYNSKVYRKLNYAEVEPSVIFNEAHHHYPLYTRNYYVNNFMSLNGDIEMFIREVLCNNDHIIRDFRSIYMTCYYIDDDKYDVSKLKGVYEVLSK